MAKVLAAKTPSVLSSPNKKTQRKQKRGLINTENGESGKKVTLYSKRIFITGTCFCCTPSKGLADEVIRWEKQMKRLKREKGGGVL